MAKSGRPTLFRPIYCKRAKDFLAQGYSTRILAGHLQVAESTIYQWIKDFPIFSKSIDEGRALGEKWYLDQAKRMIQGEKGNHNALVFMMKNIYRYSDNPIVDEDQKDINITFVKKEE